MSDFGSQSTHFPMHSNGRQGFEVESVPVEDDEKVDLSRLFLAIWLRKRIVGAVTFGFAILFLLAALIQDEKFLSNTTVMLDARGQNVVATQEQVVGDLKLDDSLVESEVAVLRSTALLQSAIQNIGIDRFDTVVGEDSFQYVASSVIPEEEQKLNFIAENLSDGINVYRVGESYVINVAVTTTDAELSAMLANELVSAYVNDQLSARQDVAARAANWLKGQVEVSRQAVVEAEALVQDYKRQLLQESGTSEEVIEQQLTQLNEQLALARSERATEAATLRQLEALKDRQGPIAVAETLEVPYMMIMRETRQELVTNDASLSTSLGSNHPSRRTIAKQLAEIDANIASEVDAILLGYENRIDALQTREETLANDVIDLQSQLTEFSASSLRLRQLEREAEAARLRFDEVLTRLGMTQAQGEIQRADAKIINLASIPLEPSAPKVKLMVVFGAAIGLSVGLIGVLAIEMLRGGFATVRQLERATGLPVMSVLPTSEVSSPGDVIACLDARGYQLFAERIRQLRMMLPIATRKSNNCFLLLSSAPDEGKTSTAVALAHSHAKSGASTILVDLDNRRGTIQADFFAEREADLSDYFKGTASIDDAIVSDGETLFDVTGASHHKTMIADGVSTEQFKVMVDELKARYDVVVIDAPPLLAVSDGLQIARVVDWVLYLVRWRYVSEKSVKFGLDMLENIGVSNVGLVMTMVDLREDPDGYAQKYSYE